MKPNEPRRRKGRRGPQRNERYGFFTSHLPLRFSALSASLRFNRLLLRIFVVQFAQWGEVMDQETHLRIERLTKAFTLHVLHGKRVPAFHDVSFDVPRGQITAIVGPS